MSNEEDVNREIAFHNKYLESPLRIWRGGSSQPGRVIAGLVDQEEVVLLPHELQPLVLSRDTIAFIDGYLALSCTSADEADEVRLATLAKIVAVTEADITSRMALVQGLRKIRFKAIDGLTGEIVENVHEEPLPQPGAGWLAGGDFVFRRLCSEEAVHDSFMDASQKFPLCESLRQKLLLCDRPLERRMFINSYMSLDDRAIHCRGCWSENRKTVIINDALEFDKTATCVNPSGYVFHLALFADRNRESILKNIVAHGQRNLAYSWFNGFTWSYAVCRHCTNLLGWRFLPIHTTTDSEAFWGIRSTEFLQSDQAMQFFNDPARITTT